MAPLFGQLNQLHLAAGLIDSQHRLIALNQPCESLLSMTPAQAVSLLGQPFSALTDELNAPLTEQILALAEAEGLWHGEIFLTDWQGGFIPVYLIVSRLAPATAATYADAAFLFQALDFEQQHYAITDQLQKQALMKRMWTDFPLGIVATDRERVVQVNTVARQLWTRLGFELKEGTPVEAWLATLHPELRSLWGEVLEGQQPQRRQEVPLSPQGEPLVTLEVYPGHYGKQLRWVLWFVEDRTAALQLEARLRETERFASVGFMAAQIAHEINNPLQSLQGALEVLQRKLAKLNVEADKSADLEQALTMGFEQVQRIARIIRPVLNLSAQSVPYIETQSVQSLLEGIVSRLGTHPRLQQIAFRIEAAEAGQIETDAAQVEQIVTNLIINAAQAMQGVGTITLTVGEDSREQVRLLICDTGPGVPDVHQSELFTPFYTTKPPGEGTGLGLYISRAVALQLGGWLEYVDVEEGACFALTLPRAFQGMAPEAERARGATPRETSR